ncbi:hypothetical protein [Metabacillus halosaccharovorans]|uniref:hypothetical protein n=1 Tax=Metabacillus halosaccharovorans TaxID=930124 RepID=UPI001C1FF4ED|nr:hypothetical protein [Metabacillus halosaccharovorans]MBU7595916.1 hypothetical protein [Metabacillus halosaccharovorans]
MDTKLKLRELKKVLMGGIGVILLSKSVKTALETSGFVKGDLVSGILKGKIIQMNMVINKDSNKIQPCYVIEGMSNHCLPLYIWITEEGSRIFRINSVTSTVTRKLIS